MNNVRPTATRAMKLYDYVGPSSIRASARFDTPRHEVHGASGLHSWAHSHRLFDGRDQLVTFTYVILPPARLFVADRHSEHVACARGDSVLTAGEITFERVGPRWIVSETSNLSTGYCPESESWRPLSDALQAAGFAPIDDFTNSFEFRYCLQCRQTCVIKDDIYECPSCLNTLPQEWNYQGQK